MNRGTIFVALMTSSILALLACAACTASNGIHRAEAEVVPPSEIADFNLLYGQNCAGCHGMDGKGGAAIALANPVFLAIVDDAVIRRTAANGVAGTLMPAFAQSAGGMLTGTQIDVLVRGIRSWAKPDALRDATPPPYAAQTAGDPQRGAGSYRTYCSSCHGTDGRGGSKASSILDGSFLALISDQELRTTVIAGRPELGAPDWRGDVEGRPMSTQDISDVVAWLSSQRPHFAGQPYPISSAVRAGGERR
ncbi:MAG: c-type cytochrome [Candidatus Sulfotelmatobacter sp.]